MTEDVDYIAINRAAYDQLAVQYTLRAARPGVHCESPVHLVDATLAAVEPHAGRRRVLEVGPGAGSVLAEFENRECVTTGVELSPVMAEEAARNSPQSTIAVGDIMEIEFPERHFSVVYLGAVIHLFPVEVAHELLAKARRWLRPGGALFVNTTVHGSLASATECKVDYDGEVWRYRTRWTEADLKKAVEWAGFEVQRRMETDEQDRAKVWVAYICRPGLPLR